MLNSYKEEIVPIAGWEQYYLISNYGYVISLERVSLVGVNKRQRKSFPSRILKMNEVRGGYLNLKLINKSIKKTVMINRLVAQHFIPNPENKPEANHINGDKTNNSVWNLEWVTPLENVRHSIVIGLRDKVKPPKKENPFEAFIEAKRTEFENKIPKKERCKKEEYTPPEDLVGEVWMDIAGFESLYVVSNMGRVKSLDRVCFNGVGTFIKKSKIMKQQEDSDGYMMVTLHGANKVGETKKVHRLVAQTFLVNPENKKTVNHKWGNKTDNRSTSLEWHTDEENRKHAVENGFAKGNAKTLYIEIEKQKKPILRFTMDYVFVDEWPSFNSAPANGSRIYLYMKGRATNAGKHRWRYKKENEDYKY
jgi:hypothetical protein